MHYFPAMNDPCGTQELISNEEYQLLLGAAPLVPMLEPVTFMERQEIFNAVKEENLEYRYINGACEDRAHYLSLLLKKYGVMSAKVWNFAPARYSFASIELFDLPDPFDITGNVTWGYHVAPMLKAYNEQGEVETLVIDQSFNQESFLTLDEWLGKMNCPRAIYLLTDINSYLFNSLDSFLEYNETAPNDPPALIPSIITGNFWSLLPGDDFVEKGLSINDLALQIFEIKDGLPQQEKDFLYNLLKDIDELIRLVNGPKPAVLGKQTFDHLTGFYADRCVHWAARLARLLN